MLFGAVLLWIPAIVVIGSMIAGEDGVRGQHPLALVVFFASLAAQWLGTVYSWTWLIGLLGQTALAMVLLAKEKMHR